MSDKPASEIVFQSADQTEFSLAKNLLETAGIPYVISGSSSAAYVSVILGSQFGGMRTIEVPAEFVDRAIGVLEEAWGSEEEAGGSGGSSL